MGGLVLKCRLDVGAASKLAVSFSSNSSALSDVEACGKFPIEKVRVLMVVQPEELDRET